QHDPNRPRRFQELDGCIKRISLHSPYGDGPFDGRGIEIIGENAVSPIYQARGHISAHATETDHRKFHKFRSIQPLGLTRRRRTVSNSNDPWTSPLVQSPFLPPLPIS